MIKSMAKKEITILNDLQIEKKISKSENVDKDEKKVSEKNVLQGRWDQARNEIKHIADAEGHGIDDGIKDAVIALNAFNINTGQSCEGHFDSGMSAPWIRIEALNEPEERFVGQNEAFEKVAKKCNIPVEEVKRMFNMDAYWEAFHECEKNGEMEDYQKWREESGKFLYIIKEILDDFYKNRQVADNVRIKADTENMDDMVEGSFEIFNGGEDYRNINDLKLSDEEKESLGKRLDGYRKEMQAFAGFLKDKLFGEGDNYINGKKNKAQEKVDQEKIRKIEEKLI